MTIHTVASLARSRRRLDRRLLGFNAAIERMKQGASLQLHLVSGGPAWILSDGTCIDDEIAKQLITHAQITSCGDALFGDTTAQTFRYLED